MGCACDAAAEGHIHVLEWAIENRAKLSENTCAKAAGAGHLHVLKWLRERKCPWDVQTLLMAAGENTWTC